MHLQESKHKLCTFIWYPTQFEKFFDEVKALNKTNGHHFLLKRNFQFLLVFSSLMTHPSLVYVACSWSCFLGSTGTNWYTTPNSGTVYRPYGHSIYRPYGHLTNVKSRFLKKVLLHSEYNQSSKLRDKFHHQEANVIADRTALPTKQWTFDSSNDALIFLCHTFLLRLNAQLNPRAARGHVSTVSKAMWALWTSWLLWKK